MYFSKECIEGTNILHIPDTFFSTPPQVSPHSSGSHKGYIIWKKNPQGTSHMKFKKSFSSSVMKYKMFLSVLKIST
jgi:hypothetical protein